MQVVLKTWVQLLVHRVHERDCLHKKVHVTLQGVHHAHHQGKHGNIKQINSGRKDMRSNA